MQRLYVDGRLRRSVAGAENISSSALQLRLPRCDLIGVDVELFRKLSKSSMVVSRIFRTFDQATAPVCMTCGW